MHSKSTSHQQRLKCKKKIKINSLQAAICNVALFKSMKDKQFRDTIFISYCEDGVILEAVSDLQWKRANDYIFNFLTNKKISLLTYGYQKEEYQNLISKGLKEITRRIKERDEECPYINIIHYQKIRKSCEYMDKEKYVQPLKDWQIKNKRNPNFAFLIVQPASKFDQVKRGLLQFLTGQHTPLKYTLIDPIYFIYLFFFSKIKQKIKQAYNQKLLQITIIQPTQNQPLSSKIRITSFTDIDFKQYSYSLISANKHVITKSGLEYLSEQDLKLQCKNTKQFCKQNIVQLIEKYIIELQQIQNDNFVMIPYRKQEQQKYKSIINKYINNMLSKEEILRKLESNVVCGFQEVQIIDVVVGGGGGGGGRSWESDYVVSKACINQCQFMVIQYLAEDLDLQSFIVYLDQLRLYYCTYLIRFYGISIRHKTHHPQPHPNPKKTQKLLKLSTNNSHLQLQKIYLIFDYHCQTVQNMSDSGMILDNMQIGNILLQLLYCMNYLHTHQQPRCLGPISFGEVYWPMCIVLPYLGSSLGDREKLGYSIQNDIKMVGEFMRQLLMREGEGQGENDSGDSGVDEEFQEIIENMTKSVKQERWGLKKCIMELQEILLI